MKLSDFLRSELDRPLIPEEPLTNRGLSEGFTIIEPPPKEPNEAIVYGLVKKFAAKVGGKTEIDDFPYLIHEGLLY